MNHFNKDSIKNHLNEIDPIEGSPTFTMQSIEEKTTIELKTFDELDFPDQVESVVHSTAAFNRRIENLEIEKLTDSSFKDMIDSFNQKYNLNVKINWASLTETLSFIADAGNKRQVELYLSELFGRFRLVMYLKLIKAVTILGEQIFDTKALLNTSYSMEDKYLMMEKMFLYMKNMEEINATININASDIQLQRIKDTTTAKIEDQDTEQVKKFLEQFKNASIAP